MAPVPTREIEDATEAIHIAMKQVREAMKGIPDKDFGFKRAHETAARDAAHLTVILEDIKHYK
ncbi:hypothetical protein GCM10027447_34750 [Glycomyces halotolerans]